MCVLLWTGAPWCSDACMLAAIFLIYLATEEGSSASPKRLAAAVPVTAELHMPDAGTHSAPLCRGILWSSGRALCAPRGRGRGPGGSRVPGCPAGGAPAGGPGVPPQGHPAAQECQGAGRSTAGEIILPILRLIRTGHVFSWLSAVLLESPIWIDRHSDIFAGCLFRE